MFTEENLVSNQTLFINFYSLELAYMLFKSVRDFVTDNPFFLVTLWRVLPILFIVRLVEKNSHVALL